MIGDQEEEVEGVVLGDSEVHFREELKKFFVIPVHRLNAKNSNLFTSLRISWLCECFD